MDLYFCPICERFTSEVISDHTHDIEKGGCGLSVIKVSTISIPVHDSNITKEKIGKPLKEVIVDDLYSDSLIIKRIQYQELKPVIEINVLETTEGKQFISKFLRGEVITLLAEDNSGMMTETEIYKIMVLA